MEQSKTPEYFPDKYKVTKIEGPTDPNAVYFPLRIDKDPAAQVAALAYADEVEAKDPELAYALRDKVDEYPLSDYMCEHNGCRCSADWEVSVDGEDCCGFVCSKDLDEYCNGLMSGDVDHIKIKACR